MTLINAMKANVHSGSALSGGLHSSRRQMNVKDPLDPKCLLSNKNVRMAVALPHDMVGYRVASTAIQAAPVVITNCTVSKVLRSAEFPDIPMSTDNSTIQWSVSMAVARPHHGAWTLTDDDLLFILGLIDGGANDELANPRHLRLLQYAFPSRKINVNGIGNSRLTSGLKIGSFAGTTTTTCGTPVLLIFHEYGEIDPGDDGGQIVHSKMQLEDGGCRVNEDRPQQLMGEQNVIPVTLYGYTIPITYTNGLPHIKTTYATDEEMSALPKIVMDPQRYDEPTTGRLSMFDE
eukprot:scaffold2574_cov165-Skeletonema_marinoi.AAC.1